MYAPFQFLAPLFTPAMGSKKEKNEKKYDNKIKMTLVTSLVCALRSLEVMLVVEARPHSSRMQVARFQGYPGLV